MFKPTENRVLVKVKQRYIKNMTSLFKMAAIENNTSLEPADLVNIVGEVCGVPDNIEQKKREYRGFSVSDIKVGDTAIFSHSVIFDFINGKHEDEPVFKNSVRDNRQEYFLADIIDIFAVVRNEEIRMQNGYVMLCEMEKESKIFLPQHLRKRGVASANVQHIGVNPQVKTGDRIYFNPNRVAIYQINGKPFGILRFRDILGKEYRPTPDWPVTGTSKYFFEN